MYEYGLEKAIKNGILAEMDLIYYEYKLYDDEIAKIQQAYTQHKTDLEEGMPKWKADEKEILKSQTLEKMLETK